MKVRKVKSIFISFVIMMMSIILVACSSDISVVEYGSPYDYPDKTWGEALDGVCRNGKWDSFVSDDDENIVEYNGVIEESDVNICIQFEVDGNEFQIKYMEIDGESCSTLEIAAVVAEIFE